MTEFRQTGRSRLTRAAPTETRSMPVSLCAAGFCLALQAVVAAAAGGMAPVPVLDIDGAISLALARNRSLALSSLQVRRREIDIETARQEFALHLRPAGSAGIADSDPSWAYALRGTRKFAWGSEIGVSGAVQHYPSYLDDDWRSSVRIDFRQPLFRNFGRLPTLESATRAGERLRAERRRWEQQRAALVLQVIETFERIVRLDRQSAADQGMLERAERLTELSRVRERQGRATRVDVLRAELQAGQARARLESQREAAYSSRRDLAELVGAPPDAEYRLEAPPLPSFDLPPIEDAVALALRNRLDYAQAVDDSRSAERGARIARRRLQPDVNLQASHEQFGQDGRLSGATRLDEATWQVGLAAEMDLNRQEDRISVAAAQTDFEYSLQTAQIRSLTITREVQQSLSAYRRATADLGLAGRNYDIAQSRAELARHLFETGRGDSFAATDAEAALAEAEVQLLIARSEASLSGYRVLQALGTLIEPPGDLKPQPAGKEAP